MKHSTIIQQNLDKRSTKKEKIHYLIYAYKEWIVGLGIGIMTLVILLFSVLTANSVDLSIRIISDSPVTLETIEGLSDEIKKELHPEINIDIQNYIVDDMEQQQILLAQMAAKEIDLFIIPTESSESVYSLVNDMIDSQVTFSMNTPYSDFSIFQAINAPNEETISSLKKAHSSN